MNGAPQGSNYRELKTILFADVVDYARLTEVDESRTHNNLCSRFSLISSIIHHHNGVTHRTEGDSILATFISPSNALQCAIAIQSSSNEHNLNLADNEKLQFRIGINCGEVLIDQGEAFGNCVNIAKRLESKAKPGSIVFSDILYSHVHQNLPYKYKSLGKLRLKNIGQAIKVYGLDINHKSKLNNSILFNTRYNSLSFRKAIVSFLLLFSAIALTQIDSKYLDFHKQAVSLSTIKSIASNEVVISQANYRKRSILNTTPQTTLSRENDSANRYYVQEELFTNILNQLEKQKNNQEKLLKKYKAQEVLVSKLKQKNRILLKQQDTIYKKFNLVDQQLKQKDIALVQYAENNSNLIEANKVLISRLDNVVEQQSLNTYENLYAEYNPVRQQIIDIIESHPKPSSRNDEAINCSIYSNEDVKPHSLENINGTTRKELFCAPSKSKDAPIPQSKLAEPSQFQKKLQPKIKKVVIYAHIPKLPHQSKNSSLAIHNSIVDLYKQALSNSSLQAYKTDFVLLTPPTNMKDFASLDNEHCDIYSADYVASVRLSKSQSSWPLSSSLVVHNCHTSSVVKRNTRYLLSDSWKDNGDLYLTPSTIDAFKLQVNSIVDLAMNTLPNKELKL